MSDQPPLPPEAYQGSPVPTFSGAPRINGLAIAALVLGIVSVPLIFVCIGWATVFIGLTLGIIAIVQINSSQGQQTGKGMAIAGVVLSVAAILIDSAFIAWIGFQEMKNRDLAPAEQETVIERPQEITTTEEASSEATSGPEN